MSHLFPEISELAFISDCQSAALIDRGGRVVWWCPPRFGAPAVFCGLLDPGGGTWSIGEDRELFDLQYYGPTLVLTSSPATSPSPSKAKP